ncbi:MAG: hypothetical protein WA104_06430 [Thermodesulfovibrionales bacterium]
MRAMIRDVIREWTVERLKITDEQGFYAWLEDSAVRKMGDGEIESSPL